MLELQSLGCHNINLVSPTHVAPQIMAAVLVAAENGLQLLLVYNIGGYDSLVVFRLLDGIIDIYIVLATWLIHRNFWEIVLPRA